MLDDLFVPHPSAGDSSNRIASTAFVMRIFDDTSSVAGGGATFYSPTFFGNAGTGIVDRFNRVFVGVAALTSSDILVGPPQLPTVPGWLDTLFNIAIVGSSQLAAISALGELAITGASRSSDFRTFVGSATGGAQGLTGIGYNDDTTGAPIAVGVNAIGVHAAGVTGFTAGNQMDMNSKLAAVTDVTPSGGVVGSSTFAGLLTSGAYSTISTQKISAALGVNLGRVGGPAFRKGIVFFAGSLDTALGQGGQGPFLEAADGMSQRWLKSDGTTIAEIWATSSLNGLLLYGSNVQFAHSANWVANGAVATSLTGVGPTGSHTTVQEWFTIIDNAGTRRYIPAF